MMHRFLTTSPYAQQPSRVPLRKKHSSPACKEVCLQKNGQSESLLNLNHQIHKQHCGASADMANERAWVFPRSALGSRRPLKQLEDCEK